MRVFSAAPGDGDSERSDFSLKYLFVPAFCFVEKVSAALIRHKLNTGSYEYRANTGASII